MSSLQQPVHSVFNAASTAGDVIKGIDLNGKIAIVTGGYSGIGVETVRALRSAGARVIVPARNLEKAEAALKGIDNVEIEIMDLLDPQSIDAFAAKFVNSGLALHILVNSAGIMACPLTRDSRGYEYQFATNHLGHFQLTTRLWPALLRANGARVVSVSSRGHRFSPVVFDDIQFERREYDRWTSYGQSKTANILFALSLDKRGEADGVRAFSVHPGSILDTDLKRYLTQEDLQKAGVLDEKGNPLAAPLKGLKTVVQGAATSVWCAVSPQLNGIGGVYCENCEVARPVPTEQIRAWKPGEANDMVGVMPYAIDPEAADRLWSVSEQLLAK